MEFTDSARRHGISEAAVRHAIDHAMAFSEQMNADETRMLILGPDLSGRMLEVVVVSSREPERVIHADIMRSKFHHLLHGKGEQS